MERNREGYLSSETHRECTSCGTVFKKTSKMTLCHECNSKRVKSNSPEWKMHQRAKSRCRTNGREFDLTVEDVIIPEVCPVFGFPLVAHTGRSGAYKDSPSLDRVDNSKGYTRDNIQVVSQLANAMKADASIRELRLFASWILSTYPEEK